MHPHIKEQFKEMVRTRNYQLEWFYKFYHEVGGFPIDIHLFYQWFQELNFDSVLDNVGKYFGLTRLLDRNGVLIAVYEQM